jgi:hypothetical protein
MKKPLLLGACFALLASTAVAESYRYRVPVVGVRSNAAIVVPEPPAITKDYATFSPTDKLAAINLTNNNLTATLVGGNGWGSVKATQGLSSGKWYWEITGVTTSNIVAGVTPSSTGTTGYYGYGYLGWSASVQTSTSGPYAYIAYGPAASWKDDVLGLALDMDTKKITFYRNGVSLGVVPGFTIPDATVYPFIGTFDSSATVNFGQTPFVYPAPAGYNEGVYLEPTP